MVSLEQSQIERFYEDGFLIIGQVFSASEVDQVRACFVRLQQLAESMESEQTIRGARFVVEKRRIHRVVWCAEIEPGLGAIGSDRRLTEPASQLLGSNAIDQLLCQAHFKLPGDNVGFFWHQDSVHRRYGTELWTDRNGRGSYVQVIIAIDDMESDNGPIFVVPGSCAQGHISLERREQILEHFDPNDAIALLLPAGSIALVGPYTIHGSFPNQSDRPRRVLINGYAYPGANRRVYPGSGTGVRINGLPGDRLSIPSEE